jgi:hypothetical protein
MYWKSVTPFMVMTETCVRYCVHLTFHHNWLLVQAKHFPFLSYGPSLSVYIAATDLTSFKWILKYWLKVSRKSQNYFYPDTSWHAIIIVILPIHLTVLHGMYHTSRKLEFWLIIFFSILCETYGTKMKIASMSCKWTGVRNTETDKGE